MKTPLLAPREKAGMLLLACGLSETQTGEKLGVSQSTIHDDRGITYKKLKANCFVVAVVKALLLGEITLEELRFLYVSMGAI